MFLSTHHTTTKWSLAADVSLRLGMLVVDVLSVALLVIADDDDDDDALLCCCWIKFGLERFPSVAIGGENRWHWVPRSRLPTIWLAPPPRLLRPWRRPLPRVVVPIEIGVSCVNMALINASYLEKCRFLRNSKYLGLIYIIKSNISCVHVL